MTLPVPGHPEDHLYYVPRAEVIAACAGADLVGLVATALRDHATGGTLLPDEAYLGWQAPDGAAARSLAMPGGLVTPDGLALGIKVINGCLSNPARGLARAQGLILVFDQQTGWPRALLEAAHISAMRTAAVTALTVRHLGRPGLTRLAVVGCGALARAHLQLLPAELPELRHIAVYDKDPRRSHELAADLRAMYPGSGLRAEHAGSGLRAMYPGSGPGAQHTGGGPEVSESGDPRECVRGAELVVTTTTTTTGYIGHDWLSPGALVAHVSLDDVLPDVVQRADLLVVDDWNLVSQDTRRLLGVLYRKGQLRSPAGGYHPDSTPEPAARAVDTTLGDILAGNHPGRAGPDDIVLSNPFGMSILDIAMAHAILPAAIENGARRLPR